MSLGFLNIVLHAHLPYVRHPEHARFFEENWLFEAITECYLPLLNMLERLQRDQIDFRLTLSLSPPLLTMLNDNLLQQRYVNYLASRIELAEREVVRTQHHPEFNRLAKLYRRLFRSSLDRYTEHYQGDLISAFKRHHQHGTLELITSAATHGFLPLLNINAAAVSNQINVGVDTFKQLLGFNPTGFWLPECGYYPGLEILLKAAGISYFFVDTHSILHASDLPQRGSYAPLDCGNHVMAFARDPESSQQVWCSKQGYPGDFDYREYYRDIGFDLDLEYIAPYLPNTDNRCNTSIKYYRVTGLDSHKEIYQPHIALAKARKHAADFVNKRQQQLAQQADNLDRPPLINAPYDAELFGHWWFEGPYWLEQVLRLTAAKDSNLKTISAREYLQNYPDQQCAQPSASTWGDQGYSSYWINQNNDWIYPLLQQASTQMETFVTELSGLSVNHLQERALNQAVRSILLAQASDWPFIMQSGTTVEYANKRITDYLARFNYLYTSVRQGKIDERYLSALEIMDNIFPEINFRNYCPGSFEQ